MNMMDGSINRMQQHLGLLRMCMGMTQEQFGEELGMSRQQIWNLEHGKNHFTKTHYLAIQQLFHQKEGLDDSRAEEDELWRKFTLARIVYDFVIMSPELFNDEREREEITSMLYTAGPLYLRANNDNERERITEDFCEAAATLGYDDFYEGMKKLFDALKAQEPRVMTLEEVENALDSVAWVDRPLFDNLSSEYALIDSYSRKLQIVELRYPFCDKDYRERADYATYGKTWRCWTSRPTDEQREATPWE